jgi:SAM-dependent methyltransferase
LRSALRPEDDWEKIWDDYSDIAQLNPAQTYRRQLALSLLRLGDGRPKVVDIGSGQGDFAAELNSRYPASEILGLEFSQSGIRAARHKVPAATFLLRDLMEGGEPPVEYRAWGTHAVCIEVLEHVDSPKTLLSNAAAYLAPGCQLVVTVPGGPMSAFDRHIGHRRHFTPADVRHVLEESGFEVERSFRAGFPFQNIYRLVVILRGRKLETDLSADSVTSRGSTVARWVMRAFDLLFHLNIPSSPWGWQIIAEARVPGQAVSSHA